MNNRASIALQFTSRTEAGADWIHLLPAGVIRTNDGRGPYRIADAKELIDASLLQAGGKLAIDENHAIDLAAPKGGPSPAVGWIVALQTRADGVWGHVEWNDAGKQLIATKAYRGISPVFVHNQAGTISRLLRASLTNSPNLRDLTALHQENAMDELAELRELLELSAEADAPTIVGKVRELLTARQSMDPARFVPIADFERTVGELNRLNQGISLQAATDHVTGQISNGTLPPFLKDWGVQLCSVNKPAFDEFVKRTGKFFHRVVSPSGASAVPPNDRQADGLSQEEIAIASNLGVSRDAFLKSKTARMTAQETDR
jgi:phage I-like protein